MRRSWRPRAEETQPAPTARRSPGRMEFAMRIRLPSHSSNRYSPKSHAAVKNTTSNEVKNVSHTGDNSEGSRRSPAVASVLAIKTGARTGSSNSGRSSSRRRACAATAENTVPVVAMPMVPSARTRTSGARIGKIAMLYKTANTGSKINSTRSRNKKFAAIFPAKMLNGSIGARRSAARVSLVCSRRKDGCSMSEPAKRNASHRSPGPKRRDSEDVGLNVKLKRTMTIRTNTMVVTSSSRERNSLRSALARMVAVACTRLIAKELRTEFRSRELLGTTIVFVLIVIVLFSFTFNPTSSESRRYGPGLLWLAFLFAGSLMLQPSFLREQTNDTLAALRLAPIDPFSILAGKMAANFLFLLLVELILLPVFAVLYNIAIFPILAPLVLVLALGTIGIATTGTVFSAVAAQARLRELLLPLLLLPVIAPVLIASTEATAGLLRDPSELSPVWLTFLTSFDVVFLTAAWLFGEYLLEE